VHCSSTVNIHVRAQKGYYLEQACTKCTYKRRFAIKHEVDIHEAGDKAIEKYM
jgi:RNase P subunit RPR2